MVRGVVVVVYMSMRMLKGRRVVLMVLVLVQTMAMVMVYHITRMQLKRLVMVVVMVVTLVLQSSAVRLVVATVRNSARPGLVVYVWKNAQITVSAWYHKGMNTSLVLLTERPHFETVCSLYLFTFCCMYVFRCRGRVAY